MGLGISLFVIHNDTYLYLWENTSYISRAGRGGGGFLA
jgi:hypothetical protein